MLQYKKTWQGRRTKVDNGDPEDVETGKKVVRAAAQVGKHDRVDKHGPSDTDGPAGDTETIASGAHLRRPDLGGDQEGNGAPGCRVEEVEQEQHGNGARRETSQVGVRLVARGLIERGGDDVDGEEGEGAAHETEATAELVDNLGGDDGADDANGVDSAGKTVLSQLGETGGAQQDGRVGGDGGDTSPRGHDLKPQAQPCATAEVGAGLATPAEEDLDESEGSGRHRLLCDGADFEEFGLDLRVVITSSLLNDLAGLVVAADGGEETRGVGEKLDADEEEQGGNALEAKQEAPAERRVAVVDEGEAKIEPVGDGDTKVVCNEDVAKVASAVACSRGLCDKNGSDAGQGASAKTGDDTGDEDKCGRLGGALQGTTDEGEPCGNPDTIDATDSVSEVTAAGANQSVTCQDGKMARKLSTYAKQPTMQPR